MSYESCLPPGRVSPHIKFISPPKRRVLYFYVPFEYNTSFMGVSDVGPVYTGPNQSWVQSHGGIDSSTYRRLINRRPVSEDSRQRTIV